MFMTALECGRQSGQFLDRPCYRIIGVVMFTIIFLVHAAYSSRFNDGWLAASSYTIAIIFAVCEFPLLVDLVLHVMAG